MFGRRTSRNVRIKPSFSVIPHDANTVELRSGVWNPQSFTLVDHSGAGRLAALVRGLDGTRERGDLAKEVGVTRTELEALIDHLEQLSVLERGPSTALDAYLERTVGATIEEPAVREVRVLGDPAVAGQVAGLLGGHEQLSVTGPDEHAERLDLIDQVSLEVLEDGLKFEHLVDQFEDWRGAMLVHAAESVHPLRLAVLNRLALALETPWIQAAVDGPLLLVGPTFVPNSSACFTCFETRVVMNLREAASYQRYKQALASAHERTGARADGLGVLSTLVAGHTALEALNYAVTGSTSTVGKVLGIYLPSMEVAYSEVLRLPGCPSCGTVPERDGTELYFDVRRWVDA